ncbi:MAG: gamma-glutamylcyclotransferase family protein [Pseudomonadota bacterium]
MHLFFYGVLREDVARWDFLDGLGRGLLATIQGRLYAIPSGSKWYPALLPMTTSDAVEVRGAVHEANAVDLAAVDAFEGPDYERRALTVQGPGGETRAELYVWISDLPPSAVPIAHGDFARWLKETGNAPLSAIEDR